IISINRGARDGLEVGHVLALYSLGGSVRDVFKARDARDANIKLPDERAGLAFVFRVFNRVSYALVMHISRPIGPFDVGQTPALAIVGSRNASAQGESNAWQFAKALSEAGLTIVSGLALGIDAAAHRGGLAGPGSTVAVLGTGIDVVYPTRNAELAAEIAEKGVLVSEFALGTPAIGHNFPRRNRLISGLARGCLVVEAALPSGSLITARLAADQGRDVYA